jgi:hypothetical protein
LFDPAFFTPRPWLEDRIWAWLSANDKSRTLMVIGGPGTGKSRLLHAISRQLSNSSDTPEVPTLACAFLRDLRANQASEMSWVALKQELLGLVGGGAPGPLPPSAPVRVRMKAESMATGAQMIGQQIHNYLFTDPITELREIVLPALNTLPAGPPLVIIIDGLDEAYRESAHEFLGVVSALIESLDRQPPGNQGAGRLRLLLASQPKAPVAINPIRKPEIVDLADRDPSDEADLARYVSFLLRELPETDRERLAQRIAARANGIWVWAFYVALGIAEDVAAGLLPSAISDVRHFPPALTDVYNDALTRARGRLGDEWGDAASFLALIAAVQELGAGLPHDVALAALRIDGNTMARLLVGLAALVVRDPSRNYRFFHGDFGRWIAEGGYPFAVITDAHDLLASVLVKAGRENGWRFAGEYAPTHAIRHALAAAEFDIGRISFRASLDRCLELFRDRTLLGDQVLAVQTRNLEYLFAGLVALRWLAPARTRFDRSVPLGGLLEVIQPELEMRVGQRPVNSMSEADIDQFMASPDQSTALKVLESTAPDYRQVVMAEMSRLWSEVLSGWRPGPPDPTIGLYERVEDLEKRWKATGDRYFLDRLVAMRRHILELTPTDHELRTERLVGLALTLEEQIDATGDDALRDKLVDQIVAVRGEAVGRPDLAEPAVTLARYAYWLLYRWSHAPASRGDDLDRAVEVLHRAIELTGPDDPFRTNCLATLANAYIERIETDRERDDDLNQLITILEELTRVPETTGDPTAWAIYGHWLRRRWQRDPANHSDDLDQAIHALHRAVDLTAPDDPNPTALLMALADAYIDRLDTTREQPDDLDQLLTIQEQLTHHPDTATRPATWAIYGHGLWRRWQRDPANHGDDLDRAVEVLDRAIGLTRPDDPDRPRRIYLLGQAFADRVARDDASVDAAINPTYVDATSSQEDVETLRRRLDLTPPDDPDWPNLVATLITALADRIGGDEEQDGDLDQMVALHEALTRHPQIADPGEACTVYA